MKTVLAIVVPTILLAACSSSGPLRSSSAPEYWRSSSTSAVDFQRDNSVCSGRASRFGNVQSAPQNSLDRPMQKWPNATAQETYEACMDEAGWHPAS